ncbi:MAG: glycosyltransferase [Thermoplasmata archaeon]
MSEIKPEASIVLAVRNEGSVIRRCLDAIYSQTIPSERYEVILVDGWSTDETLRIASEYPVLILKDDKNGIGSARNIGAKAAKGDILVFTDGDCVPDKDWLENILKPFSDDKVGGAGGAIRCINVGNVISMYEDLNNQATYRGFITSNAAYRKKVFEEVGGFDVSLKCGEDWDLWWRVRDKGYDVVYVKDALVFHGPREQQSWKSYIKKQFWYSRLDIKLYAQRFHRIRQLKREGFKPAERETFLVMKKALVYSGFLLFGIAGLAFLPSLVLSVLLIGYWIGRRAILIQKYIDGGILRRLGITFGYIGFKLVKATVRGFGTLFGCFELFFITIKNRLKKV